MALIRALSGGSGGGKISLTYNPRNNTDLGFLAFKTEDISHFKGTINSTLSQYGDESSKFVVGYTNTLNRTSMTLANSQGINGSDFNVDKSYTYLVCMCNDNNYWGRVYDIEITL